MRIINIIGLHKSGKTTIVENLVRTLAVSGVQVGTVKSRLNRARLALKERLKPHLELLRG